MEYASPHNDSKFVNLIGSTYEYIKIELLLKSGKVLYSSSYNYAPYIIIYNNFNYSNSEIKIKKYSGNYYINKHKFLYGGC